MSAEPLVSCVMLTTAGREEWEQQARDCFTSQTYPNRELLILRGPGRIGAKRNTANQAAQGEIICHWDDDDWSAPERLADQVQRLTESGADITGYHSMTFVAPDEKWLYRASPGYAIGTSLCYWRRYWQQRPFMSLQVGEDNHFQTGANVVTADAGNLLLATIHPWNTSPRDTERSNWTRL